MKKHGLNFKKFDLHVHTPASKCFSDKSATAARIVEKALREELSAIAITDHNTGAWIDQVKEAAKGTSLSVFPGVEITVGDAHIHIVALFDTDKTTRHIEDLLTSLGILHEKYGEKDAFSSRAVTEALETIVKLGGIAIPAHIDSTNGLFDGMRGEQRKQAVRHPGLLAVEAVDYEKVSQLLNGHDKQYQIKLAVYQASDNPQIEEGKINYGSHSISGIGSRFTYFKVDDDISLESIRQCFVDPDVRLRHPSQYKASAYPCINKIQINSGFLNEQEVVFHRGLNSILGAKGSGKSLLVELMRFVLDQESTNPAVASDHEQKLEAQLKQYGQVEICISDETGKQFQIARTYNPAEDNLIKCTDQLTGEEIDVNIAQLFPVLFLSQTEIIKIAENQEEQMRFIDKFFDFHSFRNQILNIERELSDLDRKFSESLRAYHGQQILDKQFQTSKIELDRLSAQLTQPIFTEFAAFEIKDKALRGQIAFLEAIEKQIASYEQGIESEEICAVPQELVEDPVVKRVHVLSKQSKTIAQDSIREQKEKISKLAADIKKEYNTWRLSFDKKKEEYQKAVVALGGDAQKLEAKRKIKIKEIEGLEAKITLVRNKAAQLKGVHGARTLKLEELKKVYAEYYKARKEKCEFFETASNGKLQVVISESTNKDEFKKGLAEIKTGSYIRDSEIEIICRSISPDAFIMELLKFDVARHKEGSVAEAHLKSLVDKIKLSEERIRSLAEHLLNTVSYEDLLLLQYKAYPQDIPEIRYNIGLAKKPNYVPLKNLSTGQKCTAMVILSLSEGNMPVVIDQPEDSLDIRAIWDDMCSKLRNGKDQRQFVFTTHNSSVAVASDSDKFIILSATSDRGEVVFSGAIDGAAVKEEVIKYLEGGIEPYRLKYHKYNIPKNLIEEK